MLSRNLKTPLLLSKPCVRYLNLHEYQSKTIMDRYSVNTQRGQEAKNVDDAIKISNDIKKRKPDAELILKAQIHAGGRGKGSFVTGSKLKGGVQICNTPEQVGDFTSQMLGNVLVTHQTGPAGQPCNTVLINEGISIDSEKYFAILMDRTHKGPVLVGSRKGGMDIETVAAETPDEIHNVPIDIMKGIQPEQTKYMAEKLEFAPENIPKAQKQMSNLYDLFLATDATQVEINPFAEGHYVGEEQDVFCVDAKLNFDDNAAFRNKDIFDMRDKSMEDPRDVEADEAGLNYIGLDGNIGCLVNGAGLAMATLDIITLHGGSPANFLDVGGGATAAQVEKAFSIITKDPNVKALLVNIFGGIMRCDTIAEGIVTAAKNLGLRIPLVVRLEGTNVELGKKILAESGLNIINASDLDDAAKKAVLAVK